VITDLVSAAFGFFVVLPSAYLAFLAAVTMLPRRNALDEAPAKGTRFAILVPAHDEESVIGRTVTRLLELDYPPEAFAIHVVADNCADATAAVAQRQGACVHERNEPSRRGKGAALNWLVDQVTAEDPHVDAYVVVDADSELSSDFLCVMARHLRAGRRVVQALNLVDVRDDRPLVRMRELAFELGCHLRPLAYELLGGSSGLFGNGMCISASICREFRWSESSVVEDAELFFRLVRAGHRVALASGARVRSVMPTTFRDARSQALRWERGRFDYMLDAARLVWTGVSRRDPNALFGGLGSLNPPFAHLVLASALGLAAGAVSGSTGLVVLGAVSTCCLLLYALRGAALGEMSPATILRILLWAPLYSVWKVWVVALAAVGVGRGQWTRTTRAT